MIGVGFFIISSAVVARMVNRCSLSLANLQIPLQGGSMICLREAAFIPVAHFSLLHQHHQP